MSSYNKMIPWVRENGVKVFYGASTPEESFYRASGSCICKRCGEEYRKHPYDARSKYSEEDYSLNILCNGDLVHL